MSTATTLAPSAASRWQYAQPGPRAAPVMTAVLPFNAICFSIAERRGRSYREKVSPSWVAVLHQLGPSHPA